MQKKIKIISFQSNITIDNLVVIESGHKLISENILITNKKYPCTCRPGICMRALIRARFNKIFSIVEYRLFLHYIVTFVTYYRFN